MPEAEDPDVEAAAAAKRRGDEAFVAAKYPAAVEAYTRALRHDTGSHALWANRSAALLRTGDHRAALTDARIARTVEPGFTKAQPACCSACVPCTLLPVHYGRALLDVQASGCSLQLRALPACMQYVCPCA